ncbi:tetrapyrrole methylase family protein/MazG family protein [Scopulibacillus daqui]|uniref:Tetrapyrrole methylase family protein/MazG family protein n=1 Tax=Scopulibacillus daqui TaxID=1469162 RepID=A0ABS2Q2E3_9BACL|nr:nucleoside triphosphate pyrophosphohydrolase [Scopulibacillus daqui]MBM7646457.1 tetrapyrrole methylase family protein/MazG family protein [Scopulibacillus daqui]
MIRKLTIIGLGAGGIDQLSLGIYKKLKEADKLYLRTADHPVVRDLENEGIKYHSFDHIYTEQDTFEGVYDQIVKVLLKEVRQSDEVVYAVPGHPMVAERTVQLLLNEAKGDQEISTNILGGQSFLDPLFAALKIDPIEGLNFVNAMDLDGDELHFNQHLVICQVYDSFVASEVKLVLLEHLPYDYPVSIVTACGHKDEKVIHIPLHELDHNIEVDNLTSVYVPPVKDRNLLNHTFPALRKVIRKLRSPEGCPWDREQTHESLKKYLVEETYEVLEAIDQQDDEHLAEELGDVLLQIMLHAQIGEDEGYFSIDDVIRSITTKMIRRHPHVFSDKSVESADEVIANWEQIKAEEKGVKNDSSLLSGINKALPPLLKALEYQKTAAKAGFDWEDIQSVWAKVDEELKEVRDACETSPDHLELEIGDLLFSVVNLARWKGINPFLALERTNRKFLERFTYIEQSAKSEGKTIHELTLEQMDKLWEESKRK